MTARPVRGPVLIESRAVAGSPKVDVVPLYLGCGTGPIGSVVSSGARGVVLAAFGAGNATPEIVELVTKLAADGIVVAVASRTASGPVAALYTTGGGADLEHAGALSGGDLSPWQLRPLLAASISCAGTSAAAVARDWLSN